MDGNEEWRFNRRMVLRVLIPLVRFGQGNLRKFELFKNYSVVAQLVSSDSNTAFKFRPWFAS